MLHSKAALPIGLVVVVAMVAVVVVDSILDLEEQVLLDHLAVAMVVAEGVDSNYQVVVVQATHLD